MLELGRFGEIIIILVAALILIGPQELPKVLRTLGRWSQKIQHLKNSLTQNLDHYFYEGKLEEYQNKANQDILASETIHEEETLGDLNFYKETQVNLKTDLSSVNNVDDREPQSLSIKTHGKS